MDSTSQTTADGRNPVAAGPELARKIAKVVQFMAMILFASGVLAVVVYDAALYNGTANRSQSVYSTDAPLSPDARGLTSEP